MEKDRQKLLGLYVFSAGMAAYILGIILIQCYLVYWR